MKYSIQYILFLCCSYAVTSTAAPTPVDHRSLSSLHHARITRDNFVARRQVAEAADALGSIVTSIISGITAGKAQDSDLRGKFTTDLVSSMTSNDPKFNYVVCHTQHTTAFDGKENTDWFHTHQEVDVHIGGTIGYEIYKFKSGKFTRIGDGGFLNWAYGGNIKSKSADGKELVFAAP